MASHPSQAVRQASEGCEAIYHAGAVYSFSQPPAVVLAVNVGGTRNVLEAARATGARLVYTSSIATVGGMRDGKLPDEKSMPEGPPAGPYKQSKREAEALGPEAAPDGVGAGHGHPPSPAG